MQNSTCDCQRVTTQIKPELCNVIPFAEQAHSLQIPDTSKDAVEQGKDSWPAVKTGHRIQNISSPQRWPPHHGRRPLHVRVPAPTPLENTIAAFTSAGPNMYGLKPKVCSSTGSFTIDIKEVGCCTHSVRFFNTTANSQREQHRRLLTDVERLNATSLCAQQSKADLRHPAQILHRTAASSKTRSLGPPSRMATPQTFSCI